MDWTHFWDTFLPFFIAFDPIGVLPIYMSLTYRFPQNELRKLSAIATLVAFGICVFFGLFGTFLLSKLGITMADFQIGGGLLLIVFSILDSQSTEKIRRRPESYLQVAVVPIAMPLLVGPAVLTTVLLSINSYGVGLTFLSLSLNLLITYFAFYYSKYLVAVVGQTGARGVGKFFSILLCAFGVMLIRKGVMTFLGVY